MKHLERKDWEYYIDGLHVSKNEFGVIEIDIAALENNGYKIKFYGDRIPEDIVRSRHSLF